MFHNSFIHLFLLILSFFFSFNWTLSHSVHFLLSICFSFWGSSCNYSFSPTLVSLKFSIKTLFSCFWVTLNSIFLEFSFWVSFSFFQVISVCSKFQVTTMAPNYAIELYFDPTLEIEVAKNIASLSHFTSQPFETQSRPHITLLNSPFLDFPKVEEVIKNFACKQQPFPIIFPSIGSFPSRGNSLFLSPIPSSGLLLLQMELCNELEKEDAWIGELNEPGSWYPQCVVVDAIPKDRMAEAFSVSQNLKLPISGLAMEIGLVALSPLRSKFSLPLGGYL